MFLIAYTIVIGLMPIYMYTTNVLPVCEFAKHQYFPRNYPSVIFATLKNPMGAKTAPRSNMKIVFKHHIVPTVTPQR